MLYDLIGVSKNDFDDFIGNINSVITKEGTHWKHVNPSPHDSVSIKFDKYFEDQFKNVISESSPKKVLFVENLSFNFLSHILVRSMY